VLAITALVALPLTAGIGLSVDATRVMLVRSRLGTAIDAAALAGGRDMAVSAPAQSDGWKTEVNGMFWANFGQNPTNPSIGFLGATVTGPTITQVNGTTVQVAAQAVVPTTFMQAIGIPSVTVSAANQAIRAQNGLEIALVLDNTGSMKGDPIQAVRTAATELVNILYGHAPDDANASAPGQDTQLNLWLSIVPFTAQVNVGNTRTDWLAAGSYDANKYMNTRWKGCVMARITDNSQSVTANQVVPKGDMVTIDASDTPPTGSSGLPFQPYLWSSTLNKYKVGGTSIGDNDWSPSNITEDNQTNLPDNTAVGPNLGCPALPVMGLQASRDAAQGLISKMVAVFRGGTFINLGLQAGWWTLSPNWRGLWDSNYPKLPLDYNTQNMQKVIVLMTDGNNEWYDWVGGAPGAAPQNWPNDGDTDFAAFGRLKMNHMGLGDNITQANATTQINNIMIQMCTKIKNTGVKIYTILYNHGGVSNDTETLFKNCASGPQYYFLAPQASDLQTAFQAIGGQLTGVRLSQ